MPKKTVQWVRIVLHVGASVPVVWLGWMAWRGGLGPAPVASVTRLLGRYALALLLLSLLPTALRTAVGITLATSLRRPPGLYAFFYALLHVLAFVGLDYGFAIGLLVTAVVQSRREIVGVAAFVILAILALTSVPHLAKGLGRAWKHVHRSVYLATSLVVLHAVWNYKELRSWPLIVGAFLVLLLMVRLPPVARRLRHWRNPEGRTPSH